VTVSVKQRKEVVSRSGATLALHSWVPAAPAATVLYVHGIQSHAGWLFETGPALAERRVALYALDRRGSGESGGERGDASNFRDWIADYADAARRIRSRHVSLPLTLYGQSLGGSIAAALASEGSTPFDAFVLCAPALGQLHRRLTPDEQEALRRRDPTIEEPVPLEDGWYTRDPRFLAFMAADPLMLRRVRVGLRRSVLEMEDFYMGTRWAPGPKALILPRADRIIDLGSTRTHFERLSGGGGPVVELPADDHYLEFSGARTLLWNFLAAFAHGMLG
jgi:alpha-beta hydrolase superfamily lysophospholipase